VRLNQKIRRVLIYFTNMFFIKLLDKYVVWKNISSENGNYVVDLPSHSVSQNRRIWDNYDWTEAGEEWTLEGQYYKGPDWKQSLIDEMMLKYIKRGSNILEIGVGAGRWTVILHTLADRLILADISKKCLDICQRRFEMYNNIEYHLIKDRLNFIPNNSIDYIWSYDVFVHINKSDIANYIADSQRILKSNGYAIIHHAGRYNTGKKAREKDFRAYMDADVFAKLVEKNGMKIVEQNSTLPHLPGDIISVFRKT
jgi:ubiquinone/menaquinone biosynthesis C-methylase UbiE